MSDIPEARKLVGKALLDLGADHAARAPLEAALALMVRRSPVRRGEPKSVVVTPEVAEAIRGYARRHPSMHEVDIARAFRTNQGRVSEALHGDR